MANCITTGTALAEAVEKEMSKKQQAVIVTEHAIHAGLYSRSMLLPKGMTITGATIKIPTLVIISGDVMVNTDRDFIRVSGYNVLRAPSNRKQVFKANEDTHITMIFGTEAKTVEDAEKEFCDDALMSNNGANINIVEVSP